MPFKVREWEICSCEPQGQSPSPNFGELSRQNQEPTIPHLVPYLRPRNVSNLHPRHLFLRTTRKLHTPNSQPKSLALNPIPRGHTAIHQPAVPTGPGTGKGRNGGDLKNWGVKGTRPSKLWGLDCVFKFEGTRTRDPPNHKNSALASRFQEIWCRLRIVKMRMHLSFLVSGLGYILYRGYIG